MKQNWDLLKAWCLGFYSPTLFSVFSNLCSLCPNFSKTSTASHPCLVLHQTELLCTSTTSSNNIIILLSRWKFEVATDIEYWTFSHFCEFWEKLITSRKDKHSTRPHGISKSNNISEDLGYCSRNCSMIWKAGDKF